MSGTHKLRIFLFQLAFKPSPIVISFRIIRLLIQHSDNIDGSKEPLGSVFIPRRPNFTVIKKSDGYFSGESYNLVFEKDGYIPQTKVIESHVNGWYAFGNFFFGGLIGWLLVDPISGAMYKLEPKEFNIHLEKEEQ